ncbi:hypothetical protein ACIRBX_08095 [Kitasatospora sp. NPDC096147]|uniref:hypothetical protein n=1 Tax=Kitasatospora sp. NPDC096147 TaxID=3364093 RepID=UPI0038219E33
MAVIDDQYSDILDRLRGRMPGLADQVEQEVRHGRVVSGQELRDEGQYEERASRLAATELPPLGKSDVAVIPYTGEERLELVREALLTLAETMYATRRSALSMALARGMETDVEFGDPELEEISHIDLQAETEQAHQALLVVRQLLDSDPDAPTEVVR